MAIQDDFSISYTNKAIRYIASGAATAGRYSVNQLYSYLQSDFDDSSEMDDPVPMSAQTPTEYTLINGWFMDYASTHGLSGGAIQTNGLSGEVRLVAFVSAGYTAPVESDRFKTVTSTTHSSTGVLLAWDNATREWFIRSIGTSNWTPTGVVSVSAGTGAGTQVGAGVFGTTGETGEYMFSNIYTLGSLISGTQLYVLQGAVSSSTGSVDVITPWWGTDQIDILVNVRKAGQYVKNSDLTIYAREYGTLFDHFKINAPSGRNAVPLAASDDGFWDTALSALTASSASTITVTWAHEISRDIDNGNGFRPYKWEVNCQGLSLATVYQWLKYLTHRTFTSDLDSGVATAALGYTYTEASLSAVYTENKQSPFGNYTGTFFGARGVYLSNLNPSDITSYSLIDNTGTTQNPPAKVSVQVTSVVSGDQVYVAELITAGTTNIKKNKYTLSANALGVSSILINQGISAETVKSGIIRVTIPGAAPSGTEISYAFTGWNASTSSFGLSSGVATLSAYSTAAYAYVPFIDETVTATSTSKEMVYSADIPVIVRVRRYGILPFEVENTIGSAGMSQAAIRTTDSIVS